MLIHARLKAIILQDVGVLYEAQARRQVLVEETKGNINFNAEKVYAMFP